MNTILSPCALHRMKHSISVLQNPFSAKKSRSRAFTLAEMMVVMLILSIVLAAMAPVVTTRSKVDQSSPWRYSEGNLSDAYYGLGESQTAMIGQREFTNTDETAKLIINTSGTRPSHIAFKRGDSNIGLLRMENNAVMLGSLNNSGTLGTSAVSLGTDTKADGSDSVAVGRMAEATGSHSTAVGYSATATGTGAIALGGGGGLEQPTAEANGSVAIGYAISTGPNAVAIAPGGVGSSMDGRTRATGSSSIALGGNTQSTKDYSIAIGVSARSTEEYSMALGTLSAANAKNAISIGYSSAASEENAIAIGDATSSALGTIAIGDAANALSDYAVALGLNTNASGDQSIALGYYTSMKGSNSIGIGNNANSEVSNAIAIGTNASVLRGNGIAIGNNAYSGATNSTLYGDNAVAIGSGAKMGNDYGVAIGNNSGHTNKGTYGVAIGYNACQNVTGSNKICIGANSGPFADSDWAKDDVERVFIGSKSKYNGAPAVLEVFNDPYGKMSYRDNDDWGVNTTGVVVNGNLIVKGLIYSVIPKAKDGYDCCSTGLHGRSGGQMESFGLPHQLTGYFGNDFVGVNTQIRSDRRLKYIGKEFNSGLDKIRQLKVFNYTFKKDEAKEPRVGVIAQDLQKVFPDAVKKGADGFLTIRMEDMFYAVINAIKELDARVTALEKENQVLKEQNKALDARLKAVEAKLK